MATIEEYEELIRENLRITTFGFGIPRQSWPRHVHQFLVMYHHEELKEFYREFRLSCDWILQKGRLKRGSYAIGLLVDIENWAWRYSQKRPEIPLGSVMLGLIHMGYQIRRVRGSIDARIVRFVG